MTNNSTWAVSLVLLFSLAVFAGIIVLQVFLSKKESKWAGLILPIISFGISILIVLGIVLFTVQTETLTGHVMDNGELVGEIHEVANSSSSVASIVGSAVFMFLYLNIPTAILVGIYIACSGKRRRQRALDKMSVQDLE